MFARAEWGFGEVGIVFEVVELCLEPPQLVVDLLQKRVLHAVADGLGAMHHGAFVAGPRGRPAGVVWWWAADWLALIVGLWVGCLKVHS